MESKISIITVTYNRAKELEERALSSLLKQTSKEFEWIVINDGGDIETREIIRNLDTQFKVSYREMEHPQDGFGLCQGRNRGIKEAKSKLVAYLDDDNYLKPEFVEEMVNKFSTKKGLKMSMPRQERKREVWKEGKKVKENQEFISPERNTGVEELVKQEQLFDSNGFTHERESAPEWNRAYRIYCDYEYFLKCLSEWGKEAFELNQNVLVKYIQTNRGVIGQSSQREWGLELGKIVESKRYYAILRDNPDWTMQIAKLEQKYLKKAELAAAFQIT